MYTHKQFIKQFFIWRYAWFLFHIKFITFHWLQLIPVQPYLSRFWSDYIGLYVRIGFALCCLRRNLSMHNKESIFISYAISRVAGFERYDWLKTRISIKKTREIPSWYTKIFCQKLTHRNDTLRQYNFLYNHCTTHPGGGGGWLLNRPLPKIILHLPLV